jgi:hypothetical protein
MYFSYLVVYPNSCPRKALIERKIKAAAAPFMLIRPWIIFLKVQINNRGCLRIRIWFWYVRFVDKDSLEQVQSNRPSASQHAVNVMNYKTAHPLSNVRLPIDFSLFLECLLLVILFLLVFVFVTCPCATRLFTVLLLSLLLWLCRSICFFLCIWRLPVCPLTSHCSFPLLCSRIFISLALPPILCAWDRHLPAPFCVLLFEPCLRVN